MICRFCGNQIADGVKFCPNCGNRPDDDKLIRNVQPAAQPQPPAGMGPAPAQPYPAPAQPYPAPPYSAAKIKPGNTTAYWLGKVAVLGALFCFFLPFLHTSVRLITDHSKEYTGAYLATDARDDVDSNYVDRMENEVYEVVEIMAVMLAVAIGLEFIALILPVGTSVFSLLATMDLISFAVFCKIIEEDLRQRSYYPGIDVEAGYGVYLAIALLVASIIFMSANSSMKKQKKRELAAMRSAGYYM